jgi:hypothetical protein
METVRSNKADLRKLELFKPRVRILDYADLAFAVPSPGLGKVTIPDQIRREAQTLYYHSP